MAPFISVETSVHVGPMQGFVDGFENDFRLTKDITVPETQYTESL